MKSNKTKKPKQKRTSKKLYESQKDGFYKAVEELLKEMSKGGNIPNVTKQ